MVYPQTYQDLPCQGQNLPPPKDLGLPSRIGSAVSEYFESVHNSRSSGEIWPVSDRPGWEGLAFQAKIPRPEGEYHGMASRFNYTGEVDFLTQPVSGDGSAWEYNATSYTIPTTDGNSHLRHGQMNNTRMVMENGELTYINTSVDMHGGTPQITEIKYSQTDEKGKEEVDQVLKHVWNHRVHSNEPELQIE
jgi:hypothetical protein